MLQRSGCPTCVHKTASIVQTMLEHVFPAAEYSIETEAAGGAAHVRTLPFDFVITHRATKRSFIVELDGDQHFANDAFFHTLVADVLSRDTFKAHMALTAGAASEDSMVVGIIRLHQPTVWHDRIDWAGQLDAAANASQTAARTEVYIAAVPCVYDAHRAALAADARATRQRQRTPGRRRRSTRHTPTPTHAGPPPPKYAPHANANARRPGRVRRSQSSRAQGATLDPGGAGEGGRRVCCRSADGKTAVCRRRERIST